MPGPAGAAERALLRHANATCRSAHPEPPPIASLHCDRPSIAVRSAVSAAPQVLSGLAQHMALDAVKGAHVVCICNLKARKIAGIESQAMVLCASDASKSSLSFVTPPADSQPGELVRWEGFPGEPEAVKKMDKKKAWEEIQPLLGTDAKNVCVYKGVPFMLNGGPCTGGVANGIIS